MTENKELTDAEYEEAIAKIAEQERILEQVRIRKEKENFLAAQKAAEKAAKEAEKQEKEAHKKIEAMWTPKYPPRAVCRTCGTKVDKVPPKNMSWHCPVCGDHEH